jgi:hypothetical protein
VAGWLLIGDVKDQLRLDGEDTDDDALIGRCILSAEIKMQRARRCIPRTARCTRRR